MSRSAVVLLAILCFAGCGRGVAPAAGLHYHNPVFVRDFPDPMVLRVNAHDYYAYATTTGWDLGDFPILHSTDLVHWRYAGDIFKVGRGPVWAGGDLWAPDVIRRGRMYFAYYVGTGAGRHCIGVATASRPSGPFRQRAVVTCGAGAGVGAIDPDAFVDRDGKAYLYVSIDEPHSISVVPLKPDLLHPAGPAKALFGVSQPWEGDITVEGPFIIVHQGRYYLFYSGNSYNGNYAMGYATGTSPTGPFTKCNCNPVLKADKKVVGPGGGSVVEGPDGKLWMAYHAWTGPEGYDYGGVRTMRIDPLVWHGKNVTVPVTP